MRSCLRCIRIGCDQRKLNTGVLTNLMRSARVAEGVAAQRTTLCDADELQSLVSSAFGLLEKHGGAQNEGASEEVRNNSQSAILLHAKVKQAIAKLSEKIREK